jgi:uncharacterized protein involved in outer membrane biogenesis
MIRRGTVARRAALALLENAWLRRKFLGFGNVVDRTPTGDQKQRRKLSGWVLWPGVLVVLVIFLIAIWDWNWFRPLVAAEASAELGRRVTIGHFNLQPGRVTTVVADDVEIANPDGFPDDSRLARIGELTVKLDVIAYLHQRLIVLPQIGLQSPTIDAEQLPDGRDNWTLAIKSSGSNSNAPPSSSPQIGSLVITDGHVHAVIPSLKADVSADISTLGGSASTGAPSTKQADGDQSADDQRIVVDAKGTYSGQPITGRFIGGALLSLRDSQHPYPINLKLANGQTHVSVDGTIEQPLTFGGANVRLELSGQDMASLYPLIGIPIPSTPPFSVAGKLDYADKRIRFDDFTGRVGSSDLAGAISVDPGATRPKVVADLHSRKVDLADLGGFIGSTPGRTSTPGQTAQQRAKVAQAEANPHLLPTTPINLPKLRSADIALRYDGEHIEGRSIPFDSLKVVLDIVDGHINVHPATLGIGTGSIVADVDLATEDNLIHTKADIDVRRVDLTRLMAATHLFQGQGTIGGSANIETTGNSLSAMLGHGNGGMRLFMNGGDLSALLVDLSGLQFGNAVLSALGIPDRATIKCLITDVGMKNGVADLRTMLLSTSEANTYGTGNINFKDEHLDLKLTTDANHFTIGSLHTPIDISGSFRDPSIAPGYGELGVRGGAAVGLGVLFPPLALLPTIQLGLGQDNACAKAMHKPGG